MRFARLPKEDQLDGHDRDYLQQLGFRMGYDNHQSAETDEKTFIHCCSEEGHISSSPIQGSKISVMDITKEHDFCNAKTVNNVIEKIKGVRDVFFYCSPCTGESTWERLNLEIAKRQGKHDTII